MLSGAEQTMVAIKVTFVQQSCIQQCWRMLKPGEGGAPYSGPYGEAPPKRGAFFKLAVYLTIILRNRAEYHLILSRRGRRPSWLNQGIFRKIEQDNCFIIQQIPIDYHFQNEKNYSSMMKTLKASNT